MSILLSFDCAHKTLGIICVKIDTQFREHCAGIRSRIPALATLSPADHIEQLANLVSEFEEYIANFIHVYYANVIDIIPGRTLESTNVIERMSALKTTLNILDGELMTAGVLSAIDTVVIEYQMLANDKSREVSHGIVYHYIHNVRSIAVVPPSVKLTFAFGGATYSSIVVAFADKYNANKEHAVENINRLFQICGIDIGTVFKKISRRRYRDVSDALMNCFAFIKRSSGIALD